MLVALAPDPEPLIARAAAGDHPVRCELVRRSGLDAFTIRTEDGWQIGVHEHTPQLLDAFAALVFSAIPTEGALERILSVDPEGPPTGMLDLVPASAEQSDIATAFSLGALQFVVAHEVAHLLLGHDSGEAEERPELEALGLPHTFASATEETEADLLAAHLLSRSLLTSVELGAPGVRLFLELAHLMNLQRVQRAGVPQAEAYLAATHPHPVLRLAVVQSGLLTPGTAGMDRLEQEDIDAALGRAPLLRDPDALAELARMAEDAPRQEMTDFLIAAPDTIGRRLPMSTLHELRRSSPSLTAACLAFAASEYVRANPFRWAAPEMTIGFAAALGVLADTVPDTTSRLVRAAVPEIDEVLDVRAHTVHWATS